METRATGTALIAVIALTFGCETTVAPAPSDVELVSVLNPFTLYVCNQSLAISPIDIHVEIDGEVMVQEEFEASHQLNWKTFDLMIAPGEHTIDVSSDKGRAQLSEEFTVTSERGASVEYWYYPESHRFATPKHFRFALLGVPERGAGCASITRQSAPLN